MCDYTCQYCHREGEFTNPMVEMTQEEIGRIVTVASGLGVSKVKITGGEPLLRQDTPQIIHQISRTPGIIEVSMTTNAAHLAEKADELHEAGLKRVNVTVPALNSELYHNITSGNIENAIKGVISAIHAGISPVKINTILLRGVNESEVDPLIEFCRETGATLQLIELEPLNVPADYYEKYYVPLAGVEDKLKDRASKVEVRRYMQNRKIYHLPNVKVEFVRPIENVESCLNCTRIRLTSDGKLKPCLMRNDNLVDILNPLRNGADDKALSDFFLEAIKRREPYYKIK